MDQARILVVDDDADAREIITSILASDPSFDVVGLAGGGKDAVLAALELKPDLILMDAMMLDLTGFHACHLIKESLRNTTIVIITGFAAEFWLEPTARLAGADGILDKSYLPRSLGPVVKQVTSTEDCAHPAARILGYQRFQVNEEHEFRAGLEEEETGVTEDRVSLASRCNRLTARELEVLERLLAGEANRAIASDLGLSENTVEKHVASLLHKMETGSRKGLLAAFLREQGGRTRKAEQPGRVTALNAARGHDKAGAGPQKQGDISSTDETSITRKE